MIVVPPIFELGSVSIADSGVPNQERIIFRPTEPINLGVCGVMIALRRSDGNYVPVNDEFFWFGDVEVAPPSWVLVYTGKGEYTVGRQPETGHLIYSYHWGKAHTFFNYQDIVPVVFRMSGILVGGASQAATNPPPRFSSRLGAELLKDRQEQQARPQLMQI